MKPKKLHITLLLTLIWSFSFCQQYTNYSTKDGLPSNHVYTIVQDAKGFMWFLTDKGMSRYNGKIFKTFTTKDGLPNNDVWDAFTTPDGKVWYFTKSTHLGYIDNDSVLSYPNKDKDQIINPLYSYQIKNKVYPAGPNKLFVLKDSSWQSVKKPINKIHREDFTKTFNNNVDYLSINYNDTTLNIYDKNSTIIKRFSAKKILNNTSVRGQITDSLFFWTHKKTYTILNLNSLELIHKTFKDQIGVESVRHPRINLVGNNIQITGGSFVGILDKNFNVINPFYFPEHLNAHFGFIDSQNTIWLSSFNMGVYKLPLIKQKTINILKDEKIQKLDVVDNQLYASVFNKGFYKYDSEQQKFNPFITSKDFLYGVTNIKALDKILFFSKSNIFIKHNNKIKTFNYFKNSLKNQNLESHLKKAVYFNSALYATYSFGIYKFDDKSFNIEKEIFVKGCNDFLVFKDRLIIATNNGLKELHNDSIKNINFETQNFNKSILSLKPISNFQLLINTDGFGSFITDLNTINPLKGSEYLIVQDAFIKDNAIWLATNNGVLYFATDNNQYKLVNKYTINNGLPSNNVNCVYVDDKNLIVGTNNGLTILPKNQDQQDLLIDLFIENATYNGEQITKDLNTFSYQANNTIIVKASTINYSEVNNNSFSYKLDPIQKKWTTTTADVFNFNNLEPEHYTLHVKTGDLNKALDFTIKPLWWQKTWFKIGMVLLLIVLVSFIVWRLSRIPEFKRNSKLIQEKKIAEIQLKALRSQMNPHFVFNSLAAIQYYINNNEIEASEAYLVKFSKLIRQFFELSKETQISLDQEIKLIKNYLDIEKLRFKDKFEYNITVDDTINTKETKLPTMLLQPIVENAINHGIFNKVDNGTIQVNIKHLSEKSIKVEITDDGVGFINTQKKSNRKVKSSNVLENRLKYLNKSEIWSISYSEEELNPELKDKGNKSTFIITQL